MATPKHLIAMAMSKNIPNLGQVNFDREENDAFLPPTFPAHLARK